MKYSNAAVATARRRRGPVRVHPDQGCTGTASGPGAKSPELMWLSLAASTKAWADRLQGEDRQVTRARAVRYLREARAAVVRAEARKGGAR